MPLREWDFVLRYCIVGLGSRGLSMFAKDLIDYYQDVAEVTGICDVNPGRIQHALSYLKKEIPSFKDMDTMLDQVPCDIVLITTKDVTHDALIIRAMERGKDVISEKPMTIDEDRCKAILEAQKRTGRDLRVTFNYRYAPYKTEIKRLLKENIIGDIHSVEFRWYLDTVHGADYFRRWHAQKKNSGGLAVHKATHHFDLINWWLDREPVEVAAMGSRHFYVSERMPGHGERCLTCQVSNDCAFYLDLTHDEKLRALYYDHEQYDGYFRDRCVFSEDIDIEDTISAIVRYPDQIQLTYALTAATSFEGWQVAFNGSKGRLEAFEPEYFIDQEDQTEFEIRQTSAVRQPHDWRFSQPGQGKSFDSLQIRVYPLFGGVQTFEVPYVSEGHGGGDRRLKDHLFKDASDDPLGHVAGSKAGAMSILVGVAANRSMAEGRFVKLHELLEK